MAFSVEEKPARTRRKGRHPADWLMLVLAITLGCILGMLVLQALNPQPKFRADANDPKVEPPEVVAGTDPDAEEAQTIQIFQENKASVVNVDTVLLVRNRLDMRVQEQQAGTGSGIVWDTDGRIVTNFHVIRQAIANNLKVRVVMADRSTYDARLVGVAPNFDLAVLQIPAPKDSLTPMRVGKSADLLVGQKAFAIGNPFGLSLTMTKGIISALDREIDSPGDRPIVGVIQTDAPINPGNSGGPLLDKDGRLIGVNTAITSPTGGNVGIGFAIPVDTVREVVTELIQRGRLREPDLGIKLVDLTRVRRAGYRTGVMILEAEGPAAEASLQGLTQDPDTGDILPGDLILELNGNPMRSNVEFLNAVSRLSIGDKVTLKIARGEKVFEVELEARGV